MDSNAAGPKQLRSFGLMVGGVFCLIGIWPLLFGGPAPRWWGLALGVLLVLPGLLFPTVLAPAYQGWMTVCRVLGWFNTRVILGVFFFLVVTPMGLIRRFLGKRSIALEFDPGLTTYRTEKSLRDSSHMVRQF